MGRRPVVGAKRDGWQAGAIEQRGERVGLPGVTRRDGIWHRGGGNDDSIAVELSVGPVPNMIFARDREFTETFAFHNETTVGVVEM